MCYENKVYLRETIQGLCVFFFTKVKKFTKNTKPKSAVQTKRKKTDIKNGLKSNLKSKSAPLNRE